MTSINRTRIAPANPLLREYDRVSPAQTLALVVGVMADGWDDTALFSVGQVVASPSGRLYKILAFTLDNEIIVQPYGLDADPAVRSLKLGSAHGLKGVAAPITSSGVLGE